MNSPCPLWMNHNTIRFIDLQLTTVLCTDVNNPINLMMSICSIDEYIHRCMPILYLQRCQARGYNEFLLGNTSLQDLRSRS